MAEEVSPLGCLQEQHIESNTERSNPVGLQLISP